MIRIVAIADTHGLHDKVTIPEGDVLVVAGDFCNWGNIGDVVNFNRWLKHQPCTFKIVVPGNHDLICAKDPSLVKSLLTDSIYLDMNGVELLGLNFFGVPWTPEFCNWAFMYPKNSDKAKAIWESVPDNTNILISHGPPYGTGLGKTIGYFGRQPEDAGCPILQKRLETLPNLMHHFCGHIHESVGMASIGTGYTHNVSVVNSEYVVVNEPLVVDIINI